MCRAVNGYLWTSTGLDWSSDTHVTLRLRRAVALSTDATLSGLTVYDGSSNLTLSPTFASAGTEPYTASAAYDIATVTVTANEEPGRRDGRLAGRERRDARGRRHQWRPAARWRWRRAATRSR